MTKTLFIVCLLALYFICSNSQEQYALEERKPGDEIWSKCSNITRQILNYNVQINNACVKLTEADDCGVLVSFGVAGRSIFDQRLDTQISSRVCGSYDFSESGIGVSCNVCVALRDDTTTPNQQCVKVEPSCKIQGLDGYLPLAPYDAGCFGNDRLNNIVQCRAGECPAPNGKICSNHGTCNTGKCTCDSGWFGNDCGFATQLFEQCRRVDQLAGDVCVRLIFDNCNLKLQMVLVAGPLELSLAEKSYPVKTLNVAFQQNICVDQIGCNLCLKWTDLVLTSSQAKGCGTLTMTCAGLPVVDYNLGCFEDNNVVPACFGTCTNDCSGHGQCTLGKCYCNPNYNGDDCSVYVQPCPNNCGGKGTCNNGVCACNSGWTGSDCTVPLNVNNQAAGSFNPAFVIVPLVLVVGIVALGVGVWYIKKKRDSRPKFNQFDLLEQDENDTPLTETKTEETIENLN